MSESSWTINGAANQPILGNCHTPAQDARGVIVISHGFKGYKDYGMFPRIAREMAQAGFIAHRFNFSHSGMTSNIDTFERPDLFELDTWNKQAHDLHAVAKAIASGQLAGAGGPQVWFGHSRGGVTTLLTAGRLARDADSAGPSGLVLVATPSACCSMNEDARRDMLAQGYVESPSSRTGQTLQMGKGWLQEQLDDPAGHDLLALAAHVTCPVLIVHGADDPSVPKACAEELSEALPGSSKVVIVPGADHVFKTTNPLPQDAPMSDQLSALIQSTVAFATEICGATTAKSASG